MKQTKLRVKTRGVRYAGQWHFSPSLYGKDGRDIKVTLPDTPGAPLIGHLGDAQFKLIPVVSLG